MIDLSGLLLLKLHSYRNFSNVRGHTQEVSYAVQAPVASSHLDARLMHAN
jgi:hypothetical protein